MSQNQPVGFILGIRDSTPFEFSIIINENETLQLDDLILIEEPLGDEVIRFYGIVSNLRKIFEGLNFPSENFLVTGGKIPTNLSHIADISVLRIEPEKYIAPTPGRVAFKVGNKDSLNIGYYFDKMENKIPIGFFKNKLPAYLNYDFISGTKGAHISISGISGIATKTSYASFLLYSLFQNKQKHKIKAVIFNVKGEDLLFLNQENSKINEEMKQEYEKLGLKAGAFPSVGFYTSGKKTSEGKLEASTRSIKETIGCYAWTIEEIAKKNLFSYFFFENENSNIGFMARTVSDYLTQVVTSNPHNFKSLKDILDHLEKEYRGENKNEHPIFKKHATGTIEAFFRRMERVVRQADHLIVSQKEKPSDYTIKWEEQDVTVVDIHNLTSLAQMFVVSSVIQDIYDVKEKTADREPIVFIMVDELNRYAPRFGFSPIKDVLIDIAERGRSLGLILIGAQQTASEVEKRVYANAAVKIVGRLDSGESQASEYHYLTPLMRKRALILPQGEMIVSQPDVPYPLVVRFPFPSWATRKEETKNDTTSLKDKISNITKKI